MSQSRNSFAGASSARAATSTLAMRLLGTTSTPT